jgi:Flp pilus assembly protein TadG
VHSQSDLQQSHTRRPKRQRGDSIVEFALLAPMLCLLLFGIMEVSRLVDAWIVVHNAAREGARAGTIARPSPDAATAARTAALAYLNLAKADRGDVAAVTVPTPDVKGDAVVVTAQMDITLYTPLVQSFIPSPVPVRATVEMPR